MGLPEAIKHNNVCITIISLLISDTTPQSTSINIEKSITIYSLIYSFIIEQIAVDLLSVPYLFALLLLLLFCLT